MNPAIGREGKHLYEFGPFRLDPAERVLVRNGERVSLAPKAFETLFIFVQHSGHALTKDELIKSLWPDSFVEENNLTQQISQLRRVLGERTDGQTYIETVSKLGYRFIPQVREIVEGEGDVVVSRRTRTHIVLREEEEQEEDPDVQGPHAASIAKVGAPIHLSLFRRYMWAAVLAVLAAGIAITGWVVLRREAPRANASGNLVRLTFDPGLTMSPALSLDGQLIAYTSDRGGKGNLDLWVQPMSGGPALQLTHDSVDDSDPAFSPDQRTIAFRSERDGGGIYIVSVQGGAARLIAPGGRRPKYSPDGNWIAYWAGTESGDNTGAFLVPGAGKIYVVRASGGTPREIRPEFAAAAYPIWTPNSRHILFLGNRDPNEYHDGSTDWWVTSIDGIDVTGAGIRSVFGKVGFASVSQVPETWTSDGTGVLMSATLRDTRNIWKVPISKNDWKASAPQRLTFGTALDMQPSMAGPQLVFASVSDRLDVWSLPVQAGKPERSDQLERLTNDAFAHTYPAISLDGTRLAFSLQRSGGRDIRVKDLRSGEESVVSIPQWPAFNPNFSPDGKTLLYRTAENRTSIGYAHSLVGGVTQAICSGCSDYGWSSDGGRLVLVGTSPARISILDLATKRRTALLDDPEYLLWNARFSPDDRWISFNATSRGRSIIFVAPFREGNLVPRKEWITVANSGWDDKPRWSPDGKALYFVSARDGFRCIWAQKLDEHKRPIGAAIPVFHAHERLRSLSNIGPGDLSLSVARDRVVFNMDERAGNLWMTSVDARR